MRIAIQRISRWIEQTLSKASPYLAEHSDKVFIFIGFAIFTAHVSMYWRYLVDDAYITFRYSQNFAEGLGLVYNADERVEGFTSILWTLWISLGIKLGIDPLLFSKISGFTLSLGTLAYLGVRTHGLVSLCLACSGVFAYWTICGLETPLFVLAIVFALGELQRRKYFWAAVAFGIIPWIRPDGQLFTFLVFLPLFALNLRETGVRNSKTVKTLAALLVPIIVLTVWRYLYYHSWQPNTYYAKVAMPWHDGFWKQLDLRGIPYVTDFWAQHLWLGFLGFGSLAFTAWRRRKFYVLTHAALLAYQAYFAFVGGDWMYQFRWYAAVIPLYLLLAYPALVWLFEATSRVRYHAARYAVVGLALAVLMVSLHKQSTGFLVKGTLRYSEKHDQLLQLIGRQLRSAEPFDERILGGDIGQVGYESRLHFIDGAGLVDPYIAKLPAIHFWKTDLWYFLTTNPEWVLLRLHYYHHDPGQATKDAFDQAIAAQPSRIEFSEKLWQDLAPSGRWTFEQQLLGSSEFHSRYSTVFVSPEFDQPQYLVLFCRQDVCDSEKAARLRVWAPNLGQVKAKLGMADADYFLQRTTEIIPWEEAAMVTFGKRNHNREVLRSIASSPIAPSWNKAEAFTALGLDEYDWKEFHAAYTDFKSAIDYGGEAPFNYSNVGWALKALGREGEAERWFKKGK